MKIKLIKSELVLQAIFLAVITFVMPLIFSGIANLIYGRYIPFYSMEDLAFQAFAFFPISVIVWLVINLMLMAVHKLFNIDKKVDFHMQLDSTAGDLDSADKIFIKKPGIIMFTIITFIVALLATTMIVLGFSGNFYLSWIVLYTPFLWILIAAIFGYGLYIRK